MKNLKMKSARAALDLSQQQLADLVGVSRQTINAIEKGDYNPTIRLCIAICRALKKGKQKSGLVRARGLKPKFKYFLGGLLFVRARKSPWIEIGLPQSHWL